MVTVNGLPCNVCGQVTRHAANCQTLKSGRHDFDCECDDCYPDIAVQERAINAALIAEYAAQATNNEESSRLAIRYFKHKPLVRVYVDDLRRLLKLATKGNQA